MYKRRDFSVGLDSSSQITGRVPMGCKVAVNNAQVILCHSVVERGRLQSVEAQSLIVGLDGPAQVADRVLVGCQVAVSNP